jgi:hypothetical protein
VSATTPTGTTKCDYNECFPMSRRVQYAALLCFILKTLGGVTTIPWKLIVFLFIYGAVGVLLRGWWKGEPSRKDGEG